VLRGAAIGRSDEHVAPERYTEFPWTVTLFPVSRLLPPKYVMNFSVRSAPIFINHASDGPASDGCNALKVVR
jgi:hypothetical protein